MRKGRSAGIIGFLCATAFGCGGGDFSPGDETSPAEPSSGAGGGGGDVEPSGGADGAGGEDKPGAGGQGGAPVAPDGCDAQATPSEASCVLDDSLGVFVRTDGDDAAAGTKAAPLRTLAKAIQMAAAQQKRVYACSQTFTEALVVPGGVEIYGGLACTTDWSWKSGEVTRIEAPAALAVRIAGGGAPALLSDLLITSADATTAGGSSIAVYADGGDADLVRCQLFAGNGAAGTAGANAPSTNATAGPTGNNGLPGCQSYTTTKGAAPKPTVGCSSSIGGGGGMGTVTFGWTGVAGMPALGGGAGGTGQPSSGSWSCFNGTGKIGKNAVAAAAGAKASGLGTLLEAGGFTGIDGNAGSPGTPGQGGGGGGGSRGYCGPDKPDAGSSGGSGGGGGCGGKEGGGGKAGGSSIALAIRTAAVSLRDNTLLTENGAAGGAGGHAQPGGDGGPGGSGGQGAGSTMSGCPGGKGGKGGYGGAGSGGSGGHSVGIVYIGSPPQLEGTTFTLGAAGKGGSAPIGNASYEGWGLAGPDGKNEELLSL
jgi:hypothetical protein